MKKTAFFTSQSNGEGGGTASASTNQSDQLPDVRLSHEPQDVKHNLVALMDFMDKGWVREKPMVAESAMHLDGMSISCWRQLLSTPGALLKRVSFVIPCAKVSA